MFEIFGVINTVIIMMVIVLGSISEKYNKMGREGSKSNSLCYKKDNLNILISSILLIISFVLSVIIFFEWMCAFNFFCIRALKYIIPDPISNGIFSVIIAGYFIWFIDLHFFIFSIAYYNKNSFLSINEYSFFNIFC